MAEKAKPMIAYCFEHPQYKLCLFTISCFEENVWDQAASAFRNFDETKKKAIVRFKKEGCRVVRVEIKEL